MKQEAESTTKRRERLRDLPRITANAMTAWDELTACQWFNDEVLAKFDKALKLAALSKEEAGYRELFSRKAAEDERLGLANLKRILAQIEAICRQPSVDGEEPDGALVAFESAVAARKRAIDREAGNAPRPARPFFTTYGRLPRRSSRMIDVPLDACRSAIPGLPPRRTVRAGPSGSTSMPDSARLRTTRRRKPLWAPRRKRLRARTAR